eukprot:TRINITY_DN25864_c0_g2_i2.p1 TRINITY_DN25864_c0_g2~~TRINITY_DN25864_c0_g2_i2.p1  ORF type:complete len:342 (+),score=61.35 TRINITY_DN25864_c0_g2_i2:55-1026(+)
MAAAKLAPATAAESSAVRRLPRSPAALALAAGTLAAAAALAGLSLRWWRRRMRREELAALFERVRTASKPVLLAVSNASSSDFSTKNVSKYLKQRGMLPSGDLLRDARALVLLLEDAAAKKGGERRGLHFGHELCRGVIARKRLDALFPEIKDNYVQQPLDYGRNSRYGDKWRISCYLVVMENWKPKIQPHEPMLRCLGPVMHECVAKFEQWYCTMRCYQPGSRRFSVMNAFVTRYRPIHEEDQLKKHIDGANVDGSVILALPTDDPFEGGALHVWDGKPKQELVYTMAPGDCMFLDTRIWHQAKPITSGTRWALVLFLRLER